MSVVASPIDSPSEPGIDALKVDSVEEEDGAAKSALQYEEEWEGLCKESLELTSLREKALYGGLRASRFRSVCWRLLLGALTPGSAELWPKEAQSSRTYYIDLKTVYEINPGTSTEPTHDNPLSQNNESTWCQYFCDRELQNVIKQDVVRTFPGIDFFRSPSVQKCMVNILFCYARENPTMCYRQGMHEVLAPLLFVVHCDHQALLHTQEQASVRADICEVLNPEFLEADCYILFRRIMNAIEGSYLISNLAPNATGYFPVQSSPPPIQENQVLAQLNWIKERILAPNDPQLHHHLEKLDISLPLFGIRWLRLLFGREFPLQDLLVLWDAIFADNSSFELVNYIVVSMLVAIRHKLLTSDYTTCLSFLMRYPPSIDVSFVIEYALHLKNPKKYKIHKQMMARIASLNQTIVNDVHQNHPEKRPEKPNVKKKLKLEGKVGNRNHAYRPGFSSNNRSESVVIDGYLVDDPNLLLSELKNAYSMMSLCRLKLLQYHEVLYNVIPQSNMSAQQALTGIHELCSLLDTRIISTTSKVDQAFEAGEKSTSSKSSPSHAEAHVVKHSPRKPSVDMTVFKHTSIPFKENFDS